MWRGSNSRYLCSSEVPLFVLPGPSNELQCNLIRLQQYSMRRRDNTLTANGLEHQLQFHCMLGKIHTYFELTTSTEVLKSLQKVFLLFMFRYWPYEHLWPEKSKAPPLRSPNHLCCWSQSSKDFSYHQMAAASEAQNQALPGQAGAKSRRKVYF